MAYNILSLDGGGTWALVQARVLKEKYGPDKKGHDILKEYNLVIANSGGSLVLSMLCANKSVKEIIDTFNDVNVLKAIFKKKLVHNISFLKRFLPNYETENKYHVFVEHLTNNGISYGETLLPELPALIGVGCPEIVITCFDYDRQRAVYFRSNKDSKMEGSSIQNAINPNSVDKDFKAVTLAQAVHGASNAPVQFFDDPASFPYTNIKSNGEKRTLKNRLFWDGAVGGNNNPVKVGVLEAIANSTNREERRKDIKVVSIGTSCTILPALYNEDGEFKPEYDWLCRISQIDSTIGDFERMATSILSDPPDAASFDAHQVLDLPFKQNDKRFVRINPLIKPILKTQEDTSKAGWYMPGKKGNWTPEEMKLLFEMDMAIATENGVKLINRLCDDFFIGKFDNQGIRIGGTKLDAILGHKTFNEALNDW
jgi:patatin-like phospholipase/acyl hydrolase